MAKTKFVRPRASAGAAPTPTTTNPQPRVGTLHQQPLRILADDTDIESFPLRARVQLLDKVLPRYEHERRRIRAFNGIYRRTDEELGLLGEEEKKREVMAARDVARIRQKRKRRMIGGGSSQRDGIVKRKGVVIGGEEPSKWVLVDGGKRRQSNLRWCQVVGRRGSGRGPVSEGREERSKRLLRLEAGRYGGYQAVKTGL
jgi:hypothetical protein